MSSSTSDNTVVILGAGQAGCWVAVTLRQQGHAGRIVLLGDEGEAPYERPPLSKKFLLDPEPGLVHFRTAEKLAEAGIEFRPGQRATAIDRQARQVELADGTRTGFDELVIATGGRPRRMGIPGDDHVLYLRDVADARRLRGALRDGPADRVICIGAGVIGLEVAASARQLGHEVLVLEAADRILARSASAPLAARVADLHRNAGVEIRTGVAVNEVRQVQDGFEVHCADGSVLPAALVVAGIGLIRNDGLAADTGIAVDDGILVDGTGRTSTPGIWAAGEVAAINHPRYGRMRQESWRHAQNHGIAVAKAICGDPAPYDDLPWSWSDQYDANLQFSGLRDSAAQAIVREGPVPGQFTVVHLAADLTLRAVEALNAPREARAALDLIRSGRTLSPDELADPAVSLVTLAKRK
jgi:3-phenylpropionate/trans-cinnamate dioxygenase ferredoxin reductase subunit